jgi:hypothetical protein
MSSKKRVERKGIVVFFRARVPAGDLVSAPLTTSPMRHKERLLTHHITRRRNVKVAMKHIHLDEHIN